MFADFGVQVFAPLPRAISPERELPKPATPAEVGCGLCIDLLFYVSCVSHVYHIPYFHDYVCVHAVARCHSTCLYEQLTLRGELDLSGYAVMTFRKAWLESQNGFCQQRCTSSKTRQCYVKD